MHPADEGMTETTASRDSWNLPAPIIGAIVALGGAMQVANGTGQHWAAVPLLTVALAYAAAAVFAPPGGGLARYRGGPLRVLAGTALATQFLLLFSTPPGMFRIAGVGSPRFWMLLALAALLVAGTLPARAWLGRYHVPALILVYALLGAWTLRASPQPWIDVFMFQRDASQALLHLHNPYGLSFPDLYGNSRFYAPGLAANGTLTFSVPYPPLSLFAVVPGQLLGDYRYALLAANAASAALMAYARPGRLGTWAAALFLFTPRAFFVLEQGWTEPLVVFTLVLTAFVALRRPGWLPWALGAFVAMKQYVFLAAGALVLLVPAPTPWKRVRDLAWRATAVATAVTLPLMLLDASAFVRSVLLAQVAQPLREDSLSYLGWLALHGVAHPPTWIAFALLVPVSALAARRLPRTPSGFCAMVGFVFFVFFAFGKQAFCNYYFFVAGALCAALAFWTPGAPETEHA